MFVSSSFYFQMLYWGWVDYLIIKIPISTWELYDLKLKLPTLKMGFAPCYENKTRSQELNLDNKCFQQSWKHHDKAVIKMAAVSEILVLQKIRLALPHGSHASLIHVCIGKAVFVRSFYVWLQNRIHQKECLALAWCK